MKQLLILIISLITSSNQNNVFGQRLQESKKDSPLRTKENIKNSKKKKPNIIFILADDLGIGNVSAYGADNYNTPNIDKLAKEGIQFNKSFTAPLCGPSRAMILTGRYAFRTGATNQDACLLIKPSNEIMIPSILKKAGYTSSCIGKWGQLPLGPKEFGFDDYIKFKGSGVYKSTPEKIEHYTINGEDRILKDSEYMPDLMHNHMIDFIDKNKSNPFFVYYSMSHVHGKIRPTPDSKSDSKDLFADNILYMDKLVGKLIHYLDSTNLRENTLIVFFGDNGTGNQWYNNSTIGGRVLSGKKGEMKECGSLVPMIVNWKENAKKGIQTNQLIDASDFLPTFAEISGVELPKSLLIDGKSFAKNLTQKTNNERDWIFTELGKDWYVREKDWKMNRAGELYDMSKAPFEEILITENNQTSVSKEAKMRLSKTLDNLAPQNGILDTGSGNGRHASKEKKKKESKDTGIE